MTTSADVATPRGLRRVLAALAVVLVVGAAITGVLYVRSQRAEGERARAACRELDAQLERLLAGEPVLDLDETPPTELLAAGRAADARIGAGEFDAAPTEECALMIRAGAALRAGGDGDLAGALLAYAANVASTERLQPWDALLERTPPDPDVVPRAQAELARLHLDRDDATTALSLVRLALDAPPTRDVLEKRTPALAERLLILAQALHANGDREEAVQVALRVVDESPAADRMHAHMRWSALRLLANRAAEKGERVKSIALRRAELHVAREHFPDDDPRTAATRYALAYDLHDEGPEFAEEALREYRSSLDVRLKRAHGDREDVSQHLSNYALLLKQSGRLRDAEPWMTRALEMAQRLHPGDSAGTATTMNNVGTLRTALGDFDGSDEMLSASLAMRRRLFPDGHPDIAESLQNLARLRQLQNDFPGSVELAREAVEILRRVQLEPDVDFAIAIDNLGGVLTDLKEYEEAETLTREALAIEEKLIPGEHPTRAQTLDNLAVILYWRKHYDEAERHAAASLAMRRTLFGLRHPDVAASWRHAAWIAEKRGDDDRAVEHYRAAIAANDGVEGEPYFAADVGNELADCLAALGEHGKAFDEHAKALAVALASPQSCPWQIREAAEGILRCSRETDRFTQAETELVRAAELVLATDGLPLAARGYTVLALIELYDGQRSDPTHGERSKRESQRWRDRLDAAEGF